jgi:hypothetical protein
MEDHLTKPINHAALRAVLERRFSVAQAYDPRFKKTGAKNA